MKKRQLILGLLALAAIVALVVWGRDRIHFDFAVFRTQLAQADWRLLAIGVACIYLGFVVRSFRWAFLLRHNQQVSTLSLLGTQVIGFTAVALIGRVADPVRPYLVSKKTGLPLSNQFAVYVVERLFDLGTMALIFSSAILLTTWFGQPGTLPHPELVKKAVRLAGGVVATFLEGAFGLFSKKLGQAAGNKIRAFHTGLDTMRSFSEFAVVALVSLGMWLLILFAYLETARAFVASPQLASMTVAKCVLLLAASGTASVFQLPVLGWFTQIGLVAAAITGLFGATPEAATACGGALLLVTFLSIVPVGLIWAQFEHVSLRRVAAESGHAGEELQAAETAASAE